MIGFYEAKKNPRSGLSVFVFFFRGVFRSREKFVRSVEFFLEEWKRKSDEKFSKQIRV